MIRLVLTTSCMQGVEEEEPEEEPEELTEEDLHAEAPTGLVLGAAPDQEPPRNKKLTKLRAKVTHVYEAVGWRQL